MNDDAPPSPYVSIDPHGATAATSIAPSAMRLDDLRAELGRSGVPTTVGRRRVVILGAGMAGLVAAYELMRVGCIPTVLEARDRVGGKVETVRAGTVVEETDSRQVCEFSDDDTLYFNTGPTRIPAQHFGTVGYCREFGLPLSLWQNDNRSCYFYSRAVGGRVRARTLHAGMRGRIAAAAARSTDDPDVHVTLREFGDLDGEARFVGSSRGGLESGTGDELVPEPSPVPELGAIGRIEPFHQYLFNGVEQLEQQGSMLQIDGGIDRLPRAIGRALGEVVRLGAVVTAIHRTDDGARIEFTENGRSKTIDADDVVITIPPPVLRSIPHPFPPEVTAAIEGVTYQPAGKLAFEANRFWETDDGIYGGFSFTEDDITQCMYPAHGFGRSTGCLIGAYPFGLEAGERFARMTPEERIHVALEQGERLHPQLRRHVRHGISRSWSKTPFSLGGYTIDDPSPSLHHRDGPFVFAGDHTSYLNVWIEGAVASAHRALRQLGGVRPMASASPGTATEVA